MSSITSTHEDEKLPDFLDMIAAVEKYKWLASVKGSEERGEEDKWLVLVGEERYSEGSSLRRAIANAMRKKKEEEERTQLCCGCNRQCLPGQDHAAWCASYRTADGLTLDEHWQKRGYKSHADMVITKRKEGRGNESK